MATESDTSKAATARKPVDRASAGILVFAFLIIGSIWAAGEFLIRRERDNALEDAARNNANLVRAFEEHTARTLDYLDDILKFIAERSNAEGGALDLPKLFRDLNVNPTIVRNAIMTDAFGAVTKGSHEAPPISLADREHVAVHLGLDTGAMFVGKPVLARVNNQWSFVVSRRMNRPDGTLRGTVGLAVNPFYFSDFYRQLDLGLGASISLFGRDGVFRSRLSDAGARMDVNISQGPIYMAAMAQGRGALSATALTDGIERIYSFGPVRGYPLFVAVGTSTETALAEFSKHQRAYRIVAAVSSVLILLVALGAVIFGTRWQREKQLQSAKAELERQIAERTADIQSRQQALAAANASLETLNARYLEEREAALRASRAKSDFLSHMSHELRTPLNAVIGFSQLLATDEKLENEHRSSADLILTSGRHLLGLVDEILDLSKVEAGKLVLFDETVDCTNVVEECLAIVRPLAHDAAVELRSQTEIGAAVRGDKKRVKQIVINFLANAVKYNRPHGSVDIYVASIADGKIRIEVRDTGSGIAPERLDDLFRPFTRLVDDSSGIDGTGIGLALSRRLAEAMGGLIGVESEVDKGSRFWLDLPAGNPTKAAH